jgi:hypothetical protein
MGPLSLVIFGFQLGADFVTAEQLATNGYYMTGHLQSYRYFRSQAGRPLIARITTFGVVVALVSYVAIATFAPEVAAQDSALTETSLLPATNGDVSDRESRLRNIEDELLKQLSLGATPSAQENVRPSLPDVKHTGGQLESVQPQAVEPTVAPIQTAAPKSSKPKIVEATEQEPSTTEDVRIPPSRNPESSIVVPVAAKSVPHRTPRIKKKEDSETLSAKDLEHRLAIAESQITLLTQELESAKAKLAKSESHVDGLTRQIEDGDAAVKPQVSKSSEAIQRDVGMTDADSTDGVDTRAATYATTARITKDHAPLRIGPGSRESTITRLSRTSIISIEHRTGGWYRIITADGTRGWISGSFLIFDEGRSPDSTVRVGAYEPRLESMGIKY